ncbi:MAG: hypothetical protein R3C68_17005 [Myxococcota bacterium]
MPGRPHYRVLIERNIIESSRTNGLSLDGVKIAPCKIIRLVLASTACAPTSKMAQGPKDLLLGKQHGAMPPRSDSLHCAVVPKITDDLGAMSHLIIFLSTKVMIKKYLVVITSGFSSSNNAKVS